MKRGLCFLLTMIVVLCSFSSVTATAYAISSNTSITISNDFEEHILGSSFAVSAAYCSDTYSHNEETISYEIAGPEGGIVLDGGMSCVGTKDNGIVSIPFKAIKVGTYTITVTTIDGATDSIEILISEKTFDVYLASRLIDRKEAIQKTNMLYHYIFNEPLDATDFMSTWVINDNFKANPEYYYEIILLDILLQQSSDLDYVSYLKKNINNISKKCISYSLNYFKDLDEEALKASKFSNMSSKDIEKLNESFEMSTGIKNIWSTVSALMSGVDTVGDYFDNLSTYAALSNINQSYIDVLNMVYVYAVEDSEDNLNSSLLAGACNKLIEIYSNKNVAVAECFKNAAETIIWDLNKEVVSEVLTFIFGEAAALIEITKDFSLIMANSIFGLEDALKSSCLVKATNYIEKYLKQSLDGMKAVFTNEPETYADGYIACHELLLSCFEYGVSVHSYYENLLYDKTPAAKIGSFINSKNKVIYEDMKRCFDKCNQIIGDEYQYIDSVVGEYNAYKYGNKTKWVITLDTNDGFGFEKDILVYDGEVIDISSCIPKRNGYKFLGWYYDKECTKPLEENTIATTYLTLYAKWEEEYSVITDYDEVTNTPFAEVSYIPSPVTYSLTSQTTVNNVVIPAYIDGYEVTGISDYGFSGCDSLTSIYVPDTVTSIGKNAFSNCSLLNELYIFGSVTSIGEDILLNCALDSLSVIGNKDSYAELYSNENGYKFVDIDSLFKYTVSNNKATITGIVDGYEPYVLSIPSEIQGYTVTSIGDSAFRDCTSLASIIIPNSVTTLGNGVFYNCKSLTSVTIPDSVTSIGEEAFCGCTSLASVTIPDSVTSIGRNAFDGCESLTSVTIPASVTSIGERAFRDCTSLTSVYITDIASWCNIDFEYNYSNPLYYAKSLYLNGELVTDLVIPDSVTSIGNSAFENCKSFTSVIIPVSVTSIGEDAFAGCINNLRFVFYNGSENDWENIMIDSGNGCLTIHKIHYNSADHTYGDLYTSEPACETDGGKYQKCTVCGYVVERETLLATGHKYSDWIIDKSVTCTEDGLKHKECTVCGYVVERETLLATGHKYSDWIIGKPVTCTEDGSRHKKCTVCGKETKPEQIISQGHNWLNETCTVCGSSKHDLIESEHPYGSNNDESWIIHHEGASNISITFSKETKTEANYDFIYIYDGNNNQIGRYSGTELAGQKISVNGDTVVIRLTSDESTSYYGFKITEIKTDFVCAHEWSKDSANSFPATCYSPGLDVEKCTICNEIRETEIPATGHKISDWITDKNATVDAAGSKHKVCTACGIILETATIPQLTCAAPKLTKVESTGSGVKVTWGKTSGADSYIVYRKTYSSGKWSGWSAIKSGLSASATSYTDATAKSGVYYIYTVRGVNEAGKGSYNSTGLKIKFLSTPKLSSVANGFGKVTVKWGKVTGASSYTVYRKTYSNGKWSSWSKIGTTKNTYYNYTKVSSGKYYKYTVRATSGDYSSYYNTSGLQIKYLAASKISSASSRREGILINWNKITGASGYYVYRKTSSGDWKKIATVKGNTKIKYLDETPRKGVTYQYRVKAYSGNYTSTYANTYKIACKY